MELWMEARALKPSRWREATAVKLGKPVVSDELLCLNGTLNRVSSADDFSVECFLDLSDAGLEDVLAHEGEEEEEEEDEDEEGQEVVSVSSSQEQTEDDSNSFGFHPFCSDSFLGDQLPLPVDDIAELEWVSRFVDDCSLPELSLLFPERKAKPGNQTKLRSEPEADGPAPSRKTYFPSPVPVKPRTKRARNSKKGHRVWPRISLYSGSALLSTAYVFSGADQRGEGETVEKKQRKKSEAGEFQRRCSHCGAHNTPQWRTGPLGAKTLCNACGVRYKSGRLCPEYRPAGSPTFSSEIHSNNHRKVLELRKRKETNESSPLIQTRSDSEVRE